MNLLILEQYPVLLQNYNTISQERGLGTSNPMSKNSIWGHFINRNYSILCSACQIMVKQLILEQYHVLLLNCNTISLERGLGTSSPVSKNSIWGHFMNWVYSILCSACQIMANLLILEQYHVLLPNYNTISQERGLGKSNPVSKNSIWGHFMNWVYSILCSACQIMVNLLILELYHVLLLNYHTISLEWGLGPSTISKNSIQGHFFEKISSPLFSACQIVPNQLILEFYRDLPVIYCTMTLTGTGSKYPYLKIALGAIFDWGLFPIFFSVSNWVVMQSFMLSS